MKGNARDYHQMSWADCAFAASLCMCVAALICSVQRQPHHARPWYLQLMWGNQSARRKLHSYMRRRLHIWQRGSTLGGLQWHGQLGAGDRQLHADW
jgi:hypothetical protein